MRSKCFLGSSPLSCLVFWFGLFYITSLLPPLSRKPLLPHLQGICFTQRAPGSGKRSQGQPLGDGAGAREVPAAAASGARLYPGLVGCAGQKGRGGDAMPSARREGRQGRGGTLGNPSSLLLQQRLGWVSFLPTVPGYLQVLAVPPFSL